MTDEIDDTPLLRRAQADDEAAFGELFRRHYDGVRAFAFRLALDAGAADDIAQETFIKAARTLRTFRGETAFRNWLFRIAMNVTRDWQRKAIRSRLALEDLAAHSGGGRAADFGRIHEALAALTDDLRHAVVLVYYEDLSHAESARILGCAETTISWRLFRARRQLKNLLSAPSQDFA